MSQRWEVMLREKPEAVRQGSAKDPAGTPQFAVLEVSGEERRRWRGSVGVSLVLQIPVVALLLWLFAPPRIPPEPEGKLVATTLLAPPAENLHTPRQVVLPPRPRRVELPVVAPPPTIVPRVATLKMPKPPTIRLPVSRIPVRHEASVFKPITPKWKPHVQVGGFSSSQPLATLKNPTMEIQTGRFDPDQKLAMLRKPATRIQTGGFGSPNGLPDKSRGEKQGNFARLGSFGDPEGPGLGNGTGGSKGARGFVASAGFGSGVESRSAHGNGAEASGTIRPGGFASAQSMTKASPETGSAHRIAAFEPVVITSKPNPVYPQQARRQHIQGEVILRVDFEASGKVEVLKVEHGLGGGLDQAAIRAAQEIQFEPARRSGRPVDTIAILHIVFKLAS